MTANINQWIHTHYARPQPDNKVMRTEIIAINKSKMWHATHTMWLCVYLWIYVRVQVSRQPYLRRKILEINQLDGFNVSNNGLSALQIHE